MPTTAHQTRSATTHSTVTRHIDAPIDTVFSLLADVHQWPRWAAFTDIRLGRHQLRVSVTSPDGPYWIHVRLTEGPAGSLHTADVTLSPTDDGGTELLWRATLPTGLPGIGRLRRAALVTAVTELAAQLASAAEDTPTTRLEWAAAARRHDEAAAPLRNATAVPAGDAVAA
jgi:uncharacterized protein YndB with AHSA1/START domain